MNKLFTKIAALALGATMAVGVGVAVASNGDVASVEASITDAEASGLAVLTSSNFDTSAEYVLKSTDGYYWNGVSGTSSSKWGGITKTNSQVERLTISGTWSDGFTIKDTSDNYLRATTGNMTWATTQAGTFKMGTDSASHPIVYNGTSNGLKVNGTSGMRLYTNLTYNASTGKSVALYKIPATKTLSSISVSGYTTEFTVGDTFSFGGTVTATYSDSTTANVTSNTTFSGYNMSTAGNYTVTASYTEGGVTKTATYGITVAAATTPTIVLNGSSFDGFTGQSFSVTATYSNLTSAFAWSTSGSGTTTETITSTGTSTDGTSTYSGTLTGAGTKTLSASGGDATTQNYVITITKTTVSLNKSSTSIAQGKSETLTATSNAGSSFTWTSSNTSAATVAGGVVSVPSGATVGATSTITATSTVDKSVSATCTVTVTEAPLADVLTSSVIPAAAVGSSTSSWGTASTFSDYTGAIYTGRFMGVSSSSFIGRLNDSTNGYIYTSTVPSNMKLKSVSIDSMTASKTVGVYAQSGAYTAAPSDKTTALGTLTSTSLTYEFAENSNYNAICLRGHTSATEIGVVTIEYEAISTLDNVTTSGQTTSFVAGNKFSYGGTLTAHYTAGKADATVSPAYFKYGASGIDPTTAGTAITTAVTMEVGEHSGKYIYVVYTEDDITKWASYQITVNYAPVTSVVIDTHEAEIGLNETYDYNLVGVTVNTEYAQQGYEWIVSGNTVNDDYAFDVSGLLSGDTEGTITLRCRSTADNSKYDELVVTVTGDPTASFTPASVSGYVGKSVDVEFTYGNINDESLISITSSNTSAVTVGTIVADNDEGLVTINLIASGNSTLSISYNGGATLDSVVVTVSNDSVVALNWTASNIKCYSGVVLPVAIEDTWMVNYEMASGDADYITYSGGDYTVKLGGSTIALPHTWSAEDDGKTLCVEYMGFQSSTVTVDVTQTLQAVNMPNEGDSYYQLVSSADDLEAGRYLIVSQEDNIAFNGSLDSLDVGQNGFSVTIENGVIADDSTSSGKYFDLTVSDTAWTITSASGNNVGHSTSKNGMNGTGTNTISISNGTATIIGTGGKSLEYNSTSGSSNERFRYYTEGGQHAVSLFKLVTEEGEGSTNIANVAGHEAAQKAVVAFAKAMNAAFDETENCTDGVAAAWATASNAYSSNVANNASLSDDEKAYANKLIKYAEARYTENTDSDYSYCLERAMATYETCVQKHGQTAFLSSVRPVGRIGNTNPITIIGAKSDVNVIAIVVITSVVSLTAIGGYFFLRKRKENI